MSIQLHEKSSLEELERVIHEAIRKTGVQKELDLCAYLPDGNERLTSSAYLRLKDSNKEFLYALVKDNILDIKPLKIPQPKSNERYSGKSLQECIEDAMSKLNVQKETDICRYIPYDGGYLHHFTYMHLKSANSLQLRKLIKEHILDNTPKRVLPKPRKRRSEFH